MLVKDFLSSGTTSAMLLEKRFHHYKREDGSEAEDPSISLDTYFWWVYFTICSK
jgi:hypothetical protein